MELLYQLQQQQKHLWTLAWHPIKNLLAVAGSEKKTTLWTFNSDFKEFYKTQVLTGDHSKTIRSVEFSNNGQMLCTGSFDNYATIYVFTQGQYQFLTKLQGHQSQIKCVSWSPSDLKIATCSRDKNIWIWQYQPQNFDFVCSNVLQGHKQDIKFVKWINNHKLVSASYDDTIKIWQMEDDDFVCTQTLQNHKSIVWSVDVSKDQKSLYSVSQDKSIKCWRQKNDKYELSEQINDLHIRPIYSCSVNNSNKILVTCGGDNSIGILKMNQGKIIKSNKIEQAHKNDINCIRFNRNNNIVGTCGDDYKIKIWRIIDQ